MLYNILLIVQILVAVGIIGLVLIQHGKGADAGAAFGGGASGTVFGSRGSGNFLTKLTTALAVAFFSNSLLLAWLVAHPDSTRAASIVPTVVSEKPATKPSPKTAPLDVPGSSTPTGNVPAASSVAPTNKDTAPTDIPK